MKRLATVLAFLAAGCVSTPNVPPVQYYVLADNNAAAAQARRTGEGRVLLVQPTSVGAFYDTQRLVYSRAPGERAYYQFAAWTERPARAFTELLSRRLGGALTTDGVRGELVLQTRLEELYHDAGKTPGRVVLDLSAQLVDASGRRIGQPNRFLRGVPTASENAAAAVQAANEAVAAVLDDIAAWYAAIPLGSEARLGLE